MKKTKCQNLVFSSTAAIYQGSRSIFLKEDSKIFYNLLNPYALSKYLSEKFLKNACYVLTIYPLKLLMAIFARMPLNEYL
jgi:UDP-glucose 4-epimerase